MSRTLLAVLAAALVAGACGDNEKTERQATPGMSNLPGMPGMPAMPMKTMDLMPAVRAHLDSVAGMSAQAATGRLAAHDALMSQMLDAMGADMTNMGMQADAGWTALADSVRRDLAELPGLSGRGLEARLRSHVERVRRLLGRHEEMINQTMKR